MTQQQYDYFKNVIDGKGYTLCNYPKTISNESFYYYKGFAHTEDENGNKIAGYRVIFLVWDFREFPDIPDYDAWGVTPLILTDSHEWSRIDLEITENNFDVEKVEEFAHDFYYQFLLTHGL